MQVRGQLQVRMRLFQFELGEKYQFWLSGNMVRQQKVRNLSGHHSRRPSLNSSTSVEQAAHVVTPSLHSALAGGDRVGGEDVRRGATPGPANGI